MRKLTRADFKVPAWLIALSVVPTLGGVVRLISVSGHTKVTPDNARFLHAPTAVVIHVICATLYCLIGAFQFSPGFRLRWPSWHRRAGRVLALFGLAAGVSGAWMTMFYRIPPSMQGPILYAVRLAVASGMVASIILGVLSIRQRDVARHEAFMIRAYALGQGAGTQVLVLLPWMLISGEAGGLTRDLLMTLAWAINVVVAEWIIRRKPRSGRVSRRAMPLVKRPRAAHDQLQVRLLGNDVGLEQEGSRRGQRLA
jgi:hypothetical protein